MFNLNEGILALIPPESLAIWQSVLISVLTVIGAMLVGYLLGSVNSAIIISRVLFRDDIRRHGSGNAGLTNMLRTYGKGAAGLTLLGDFLKTALSLLIMGIVQCASTYAKTVSHTCSCASWRFPISRRPIMMRK